jgi:hypothetical protein
MPVVCIIPINEHLYNKGERDEHCEEETYS